MIRHTLRAAAVGALVVAVLAGSGCAQSSATVTARRPVSAGDQRASITIAVTPAVSDSGLGDSVRSSFAAAYPEYRVSLVATSSSGVLAVAKAGQADVVVAPQTPALAAFVKDGFGFGEAALMDDVAVLVGPKEDPAGTAAAPNTPAALAAIASKAGALSSPGQVPVRYFAGPASGGTSALETALWNASGAKPSGSWYSTVDGTPQALLDAATKGQGYAIIDRAELLSAQGSSPGLGILRTLGPQGVERYVVVIASGARDLGAARAFTSWLTAGPGAALVSSAGVARFGKQLFTRPGAAGAR